MSNVSIERRKEVHQIIADHGGCDIDYDYDFDSDDHELDIAMLMDDMFSKMAENASIKDAEGYSFSTNTDMPQWRYLQLVELTTKYPQYRFKDTSRDGTTGYSIYTNSELGDTSNAWSLGCGIGVYSPFWFNHEKDVRIYEDQWKPLMRQTIGDNSDYIQDKIIERGHDLNSFDSFLEIRNTVLTELLSLSKFDYVSSYDIPFIGNLKGFDEPIKFFADYKIAGVQIINGEVYLIMYPSDHQWVRFSDDTVLPMEIAVPADFLAYTYDETWKDYVCQDLSNGVME